MNLEEASSNFDAGNVKPFLEKLKPLITSGFSDNEIMQVQQLLESLQLDDEEGLEFPIMYKGNPTVLRISIFMDDINSPDVYFFTHPDLAAEIENQFDQFAEEFAIES